MLDAIGLVSSNISDSIAFYKHLGVNFKQFEDSEHYESQLASGLRIMLDSEELMKDIIPGYKKPDGSKMTLCFKKNNADEVNQLTNDLNSAGYNIIKEPWDAYWGQRYACVLDPDGNQIDIFSPLN